MKKIIVVLIVLLATSAYADRWCEWSGTAGVNCKNDNYPGVDVGVLRSPTGTLTGVAANIALINNWGLFQTTTTQPVVGADETRDAEVWEKVDNQISLTWTVRDLTTEELNQRAASPMAISDYLQWKLMVNQGVVTANALRTYFQNNYPELEAAFLARQALEE